MLTSKLTMARKYHLHDYVPCPQFTISFIRLIRTIGAASTILLKNENNVLPLKAPQSIAVVGNGAGNSSLGPNGCVLFSIRYETLLN